MSGFDAELYLRLVGERMLAQGRGVDEASPLREAAQALLATDRIDEATAEAVLADYRLASMVRGDHEAFMYEGEREPPATEPLEPRRVARCEAELELSAGTLRTRYVTFSEESTTLDAVLRFASARRRRGPYVAPPSLKLGDDQGTTSASEFSGGGGEHEWEGRFSTHVPLAADTAYIEIEAHRVELVALAARAETRVESLPDVDPAIGHLWQCVTPNAWRHGAPAHEAAIEALVAAGALARDHPALADIRAVGNAGDGMWMHHGRAPRGLPEPWKSALSGRNSVNGPTGMIPVGASTPVFDGVAVAVSALISSRESWQLDVDVAPGSAMFGGAAVTLVWWAADDRGHHYLGMVGSWSGGEDGPGSGEIHFHSALDPKATYVDLQPTAQTQRAVIRVPLEWS